MNKAYKVFYGFSIADDYCYLSWNGRGNWLLTIDGCQQFTAILEEVETPKGDLEWVFTADSYEEFGLLANDGWELYPEDFLLFFKRNGFPYEESFS